MPQGDRPIEVGVLTLMLTRHALDKTLELSESHVIIYRRKNQDTHNQRDGRGSGELRGDLKEQMS